MFSSSKLCLKRVIELGSFFLISKYFCGATFGYVIFQEKEIWKMIGQLCHPKNRRCICHFCVYVTEIVVNINVAVCCENLCGKVIFGIIWS